ncbi:hypothetical protein EJ08DRAFT_653515 [Tothia fuscella]|uniref:Zn(2)-C6 fungal-type domain-containing protein n=1 Tax=Tothia fuscella TaxID=1048955 RepID=A0A9P4TSY5_9PEZI|nr:hypothetical protein EJ08DRAFT_653515 [Tothia fuscella]
MRQKKPRSRASQHSTIPGYLCFSLNPGGLTSRASYTASRREEVNELRKIGACLRCQLLKKPCSNGNPCDRCSKVAVKNSASRCLAWMECVRPCLTKISIYKSDPWELNTSFLGGTPVLQYFADGNVQLKLDIPFRWNFDELSTFVASWLTTDDSPKGSMVGIMSSASLYLVLSDIIGTDLARDFKTLIYTTSLLYDTGEINCPEEEQSSDFKVVHYCGQQILTYLDANLRPTPLAKQSKHGLYALFLLCLGAIISSNYFGCEASQFSEMESEVANSKSADLVRLLTHYMVYIGQQVGLLNENWTEKTNACLSLPQWSQRPSRLVDHYLHSTPKATTLLNVRPRHDSAHDIEPDLPQNTREEPDLGHAGDQRGPEISELEANFDWSNLFQDPFIVEFNNPTADPNLPSMGFTDSLWDTADAGTYNDWSWLNNIPSPVLSQSKLAPLQ